MDAEERLRQEAAGVRGIFAPDVYYDAARRVYAAADAAELAAAELAAAELAAIQESATAVDLVMPTMWDRGEYTGPTAWYRVL